MPKSWQEIQLRHARYRAKLKRSQRPRKPGRPRITKAEFVEALRGTGGIKTTIAERLGVYYGTVSNLLNRPDWQDVRREWAIEKERGVEIAKATIMDAIQQRLDIGIAAANARWLLSKALAQEYGDKITQTIQGGSEPIKIMSANVDVSALPLELRRQLLEAIEAGQPAKVLQDGTN